MGARHPRLSDPRARPLFSAPRLGKAPDADERPTGEAYRLVRFRDNPSEKDHRQLQGKLEEIISLINDESVQSAIKREKTRALTTDMIPIAQAVFKEAWKRTK